MSLWRPLFPPTTPIVQSRSPQPFCPVCPCGSPWWQEGLGAVFARKNGIRKEFLGTFFWRGGRDNLGSEEFKEPPTRARGTWLSRVQNSRFLDLGSQAFWLPLSGAGHGERLYPQLPGAWRAHPRHVL